MIDLLALVGAPCHQICIFIWSSHTEINTTCFAKRLKRSDRYMALGRSNIYTLY